MARPGGVKLYFAATLAVCELVVLLLAVAQRTPFPGPSEGKWLPLASGGFCGGRASAAACDFLTFNRCIYHRALNAPIRRPGWACSG